MLMEESEVQSAFNISVNCLYIHSRLLSRCPDEAKRTQTEPLRTVKLASTQPNVTMAAPQDFRHPRSRRTTEEGGDMKSDAAATHEMAREFRR
jgi:hypothetical protein